MLPCYNPTMNFRAVALLSLHFLLLLLLAVLPAQANNEFNGSASLGFDDNISNAVSDRDIFSDSFLTANFNATRLWVPAAGKSLLLSGHLGMQNFRDADGLNRFSYGSSVSYIQRLGLGAYAPRISASLRADYRNFDTDMRDGMLYRASIGLEKRFTPDLMTGVTLTRERRDADASRAIPYVAGTPQDVFDQQNSELSAFAEYTLPNNQVIAASYLYRHGQTDASTNPGSAFFSNTKAIAQDHYLCAACSRYVAYRINADIHALQLAWNVALANDTSVSASWQRRLARVDGGVTYTGTLYQLQLQQRF